MASSSHLSDDECFQLALALSLSDSTQSQQKGGFHGHATRSVDTSRDEEMAMQLQRELRLREFSGSGGHDGRGGDSGSASPSAPPAPPPQQRQVPLLGQPPTPAGVGSLFQGLKNLPIMRRTGSVPQAQPAVPPGAGGTDRALDSRIQSLSICTWRAACVWLSRMHTMRASNVQNRIAQAS